MFLELFTLEDGTHRCPRNLGKKVITIRWIISQKSANLSYFLQWSSMELHNLPFIHLFIPLVCEKCDDSLSFTGTSSISLCCILFPAILLHKIFFYLSSLHLAIYFLVYFLVLLITNSYKILFWKFYFLPFPVHVKADVICIYIYVYIYIYIYVTLSLIW
jgi:hypothetical protein